MALMTVNDDDTEDPRSKPRCLGTFPTRAEANRVLSLAVADQSRGAWVDPTRGRELLRTYAAAWIEDHPGLRPRTRRPYQDLLRLHILPVLGHIDLGKLTPRLVRAWYAGLASGNGPGASTAAKAYRLLHTIMATATADELVSKNPCLLAHAGRERPAERPVISVVQVTSWRMRWSDDFGSWSSWQRSPDFAAVSSSD